MKKKIKIEIDEWVHNCSDGCCTTYGTTTKVNGEEMPLINQDVGTIVTMILEHLGYEVELIETYNEE
jgi:hypothetical protein